MSICWHRQRQGLEVALEQDISHQGLQNLILCYDKCLNKSGNYVEK
jgi:hypothetical protein